MRITGFTHDDIEPFLMLAVEEGWLCEPAEFDFLLRAYPQGCFVARSDGGAPLGFITSIAYQRSGWIGNLIVSREYRRTGVGTLLMQQCLDMLAYSGAKTVWLTASPSGATLYERLGFRGVDRVVRWRLDRGIGLPPQGSFSEKEMTALAGSYSLGWGDDRSLICRETARRGTLFFGVGASLATREITAGTCIGPWVADTPKSATLLLETVLKSDPVEGATFADVPAMNEHAAVVLDNNRFTRYSETVLMYRGEPPEYRAGLIFALASFGSIG